MRLSSWFLALLSLTNSHACAAEFKPPIVIEPPFPEEEGWFGLPSSVPDVNGDGRPDILICAGGGAAGVFLYDGVSRELLREFGGGFGFGIDDVNGDARGDIVLTSGDRQVLVLDGTTGDIIHFLEPTKTLGGSFQVREVSTVPDVSGDGRPEIAIGTCNFDGSNSGVVKLHDGASGAELRTLSGRGFFGESVSGVPDVNGDGRGDVVVGAWMANRAFIYDGATGDLLSTLTGTGQFGRSVLGLGDVTGDGRGDVVVAASDVSRAYIYDGAQGTRLHTLSVRGSPTYLGWVLNRLPDIDGDGRDDVVLGSPHTRQPPANVYIFSGATGQLLATLGGHSRAYGRSVAGLPDMNGDGLGEVIVANQFSKSTDGVDQAGEVRLHLSVASPKAARFTALTWTHEGLKLLLTGEGSAKFELQRSIDLRTWTTILSQVQASQTAEFLDSDVRNTAQAFYRARSIP